MEPVAVHYEIVPAQACMCSHSECGTCGSGIVLAHALHQKRVEMFLL